MHHRLQRIERYLNDVEMKGYFNWHNHPMSKFYSEAAKFGLTEWQGLLQMRDMHKTMRTHREKRHQPDPPNSDCTDRTARMTGAFYVWSLKDKQVLALAKKSTRVRDVIRRICMLYAVDYRCLSVTIPEPCKDLQIDVNDPDIKTPDEVDMHPEKTECCKRVAKAKLARTSDAPVNSRAHFRRFVDSDS